MSPRYTVTQLPRLFNSRPAKDAPHLPLAEETALITAAQAGDRDAQLALLWQYRGLLQWNASRVRTRIRGMSKEQVEDLEGDLVVTALAAIQDLDLTKHFRLAATLKNALSRLAAHRTAALEIPRTVLARWSKILGHADGDVQKAAEIAPEWGMTSDTFRAVHAALDFTDQDWSAEPYTAARGPVVDTTTYGLAHSALESLKPEDRQILELAYGFSGDPKSDGEVADILGLPMRTVQTRRVRALGRLRTTMAAPLVPVAPALAAV